MLWLPVPVGPAGLVPLPFALGDGPNGYGGSDLGIRLPGELEDARRLEAGVGRLSMEGVTVT